MLKISGLTKEYGKITAVDNFNLEVNRGETVVVMGPSGCGKSTMIRCINRLTEPDSGFITVNDIPVLNLEGKELQDFRRRIGFVFQHFNLISRMTVLQNVMFHLVLAGIAQDRATAQAKEALNKVGMDDHWAKKPTALSGGEQQRVGIARALASRPQLMLWDEPTASLDPILVGEVLEVMEELVRTTKTTMLIVTHEVGFAQKVADRIILMDHGRIVEQGEPNLVFANPQSEIGRKYRQLIAG